MTDSPHKISIALRPLSWVLHIFGLLPLKINSKYEVEEINFDVRPFCFLYDLILITIICGCTLIYICRELDAVWLTIIHVTYMFSRTAKVLVLNIRRWTCKEVLLDVWMRFTVNEASYYKYGVKFKVTYVVWCGFGLIITNTALKFLFFTLIYYEGSNRNSTRPNYVLVGIASLVDFPITVIVAEYITYFLILREYFQKLGTAFTKMITREFLIRDKNDSQYVKMISLSYFATCDVCNKATKILRACVVVGMIDSLMISTVHAHNLISKIYAGRITEYWFFDYKYSAIMLIEQTITFISVILATHLLVKSADNIKDTLRNLDTSNVNQATLQSIKLLSLQILHEDFKITPAGLFTIDISLVYVVFGTLASYIVIIIQFDVMYYR